MCLIVKGTSRISIDMIYSFTTDKSKCLHVIDKKCFCLEATEYGYKRDIMRCTEVNLAIGLTNLYKPTWVIESILYIMVDAFRCHSIMEQISSQIAISAGMAI